MVEGWVAELNELLRDMSSWPGNTCPFQPEKVSGPQGSAIAFRTFAVRFSSSADRCRSLAGPPFRRFLVVTTQFHLAVNALALQLLF